MELDGTVIQFNLSLMDRRGTKESGGPIWTAASIGGSGETHTLDPLIKSPPEDPTEKDEQQPTEKKSGN